MKKYSIKRSTLFIVAALIILFFSLMSTFQKSVGLQGDIYESQSNSAQVIRLLGSVQANLLQARRREKDFLLHLDKKYLDMHKSIMRQLYSDISSLTNFLNTKEIIQLSESVLIFAIEYEDIFGQVATHYQVVGLDERSGMLGKLARLATEIEDTISEKNSEFDETIINELNWSLLLMQRSKMAFQGQDKNDVFEKFDLEYRRFKTIVGMLSEENSSILKALLEQYYSEYKKLSDRLLDIEQEINTFRDSVSEIDPLIADINEQVSLLHERKVVVLKEQSKRTQTTFYFYSFLAALLAFFIIFLFLGLQKTKTKLASARDVAFRDKEFAQATLKSIADGVIITDENGMVIQINAVAADVTQKTTDELVNVPANQALSLVFERSNDSEVHPVDQCISRRKTIPAQNCTIIRNNKKERKVIELSVAPIFDQGQRLAGTIMVFRDVSEQQKLIDQIKYQASHDALTGLVNRSSFDENLAKAWEQTNGSEIQHMLLYVDLDRFKVLNDNCGHLAGDELLIQFSELVWKRIRRSDVLADFSNRSTDDFVNSFARIGGDEFAILLTNCPLEAAQRIAASLVEDVKAFNFLWEGKSYSQGVSIGISSVTNSQSGPDDALREADTACLKAKNSGRGRVVTHHVNDDEMRSRRAEMKWVPRINRALEENSFVLYQQAIVDIYGDGPGSQHVEILIRLLDKNEIIPPGAFLPAAERYNLMVEIDKWVIDHTFLHLSRLSIESMDRFTCSINLSGQSMSDHRLVEFIDEKFHEYGVKPSWVCFEITESAAIANLRFAKEIVKSLRDMGCRFSLDDFGSGLSSFAYLKELPVNYLKIDGNFIKDIDKNPFNLEFVKAINQVGHSMGLQTIAEFVENQEIMEILQEIGVDYGQGFHIAKPAALTDLVLNLPRNVEPRVAENPGL